MIYTHVLDRGPFAVQSPVDTLRKPRSTPLSTTYPTPNPADSSDMGGWIRCRNRKGLDLQRFEMVVFRGRTEWSVSSNTS